MLQQQEDVIAMGMSALPAEGGSEECRQILNALADLKEKGLQFSDVVALFGVGPDNPYVAAARASAQKDQMETDEVSVISVAPGRMDPGAYVMSWRWISDEQAGIVND